MQKQRPIWKNVGFAAATLFFWAAGRVFAVRVLHGSALTFDGFDVAFTFLPPVIAFFLNWYWLREQLTESLIKWAIS